MFARVEVAMRPEADDPGSKALLRRIELFDPGIRKKIRWARLLDVYLLELPIAREELSTAVSEIFWDPVLQWLFTGNLIPSAAGGSGGLPDLLAASPVRPGKFWAIEKRFRPGVTDNVGRTALEAFEICTGKKLDEGRVASGGLWVFEGPSLDENDLSVIARGVFCNELIESWTIVSEADLKRDDRFGQDRIQAELPRVHIRGSDEVREIRLEDLDDAGLEELSKKNLWALSLAEMRAIREFFGTRAEKERRGKLGLEAITDVEMEVIAQTWSEHCKHKIFNAKIRYEDQSGEPGAIPAKIESLFKETIAGTTAELPKPWLLSVFSDNAGIVAFDADDAFCIKVETHNSPSALDPYGGALTGIVGVNRDILGCGLGAKPIFNTDVFCVAVPDHSGELPERLLHPRRILDGVRRGVEHGGNKSGIPTVNGALVFDERYLGKPLIYCGTGGFMPRMIAGRKCETKEIFPNDRICMVGGRIGKDGIHGATFSSLALDESSPVTAVQLGDPITQKRAADFLLEARDLGLYRAVTDNGAGGLSSSVGELATLSGGARMDVSRAKVKYPGLKPYELVVSESQERMTVAVPPEKLSEFLALAERRGVEASDLGEFTESGSFDLFSGEKRVASLDLHFLHKGAPRLEIEAKWEGVPQSTPKSRPDFRREGGKALLGLLSRPNIASKEWLIRQYDHEVQGASVIKPLHTALPGTAAAWSGPNDAGVVKPKPDSQAGIAVGCGINPKLSDVDPFLMAQSAVDESIRNVLCAGAEFGKRESVVALVDNFCWPDPVSDPGKAAALVRACYGLREAALALSAPLVSGKDSMKNDFRGRLRGKPVSISVPPTLLMTCVARVPDVRAARTADFKGAGDAIYLLGGLGLGLRGSELEASGLAGVGEARLGRPDWELARRIYSWIGNSGEADSRARKLRSLHDVSEGGVLVAIAESLLARGLGAALDFSSEGDPWELSFGEGFHTFVASADQEDAEGLEREWKKLEIPFRKLGTVSADPRISIEGGFSVGTSELRSAWLKEGYWE